MIQPEPIPQYLVNQSDEVLIKKKQQVKRLILAPHRRGLNYIKLLDIFHSINCELLDRKHTREMI